MRIRFSHGWMAAGLLVGGAVGVSVTPVLARAADAVREMKVRSPRRWDRKSSACPAEHYAFRALARHVGEAKATDIWATGGTRGLRGGIVEAIRQGADLYGRPLGRAEMNVLAGASPRGLADLLVRTSILAERLANREADQTGPPVLEYLRGAYAADSDNPWLVAAGALAGMPASYGAAITPRMGVLKLMSDSRVPKAERMATFALGVDAIAAVRFLVADAREGTTGVPPHHLREFPSWKVGTADERFAALGELLGVGDRQRPPGPKDSKDGISIRLAREASRALDPKASHAAAIERDMTFDVGLRTELAAIALEMRAIARVDQILASEDAASALPHVVAKWFRRAENRVAFDDIAYAFFHAGPNENLPRLTEDGADVSMPFRISADAHDRAAILPAWAMDPGVERVMLYHALVGPGTSGGNRYIGRFMLSKPDREALAALAR